MAVEQPNHPNSKWKVVVHSSVLPRAMTLTVSLPTSSRLSALLARFSYCGKEAAKGILGTLQSFPSGSLPRPQGWRCSVPRATGYRWQPCPAGPTW